MLARRRRDGHAGCTIRTGARIATRGSGRPPRQGASPRLDPRYLVPIDTLPPGTVVPTSAAPSSCMTAGSQV